MPATTPTADPTGVGRGDTTASGRPEDPPLDFSSLWPDVDAITCPTMLVRGGDSFHVPDAHAEALRRRRPGARLEVVPGARHAVQSDKPAELAALIENFAFGPRSQS